MEGSIYISKTSVLLKKKTFYHEKTQAFKVDKWKSLEIDDIYDFNLAKLYANKLSTFKNLNKWTKDKNF